MKKYNLQACASSIIFLFLPFDGDEDSAIFFLLCFLTFSIRNHIIQFTHVPQYEVFLISPSGSFLHVCSVKPKQWHWKHLDCNNNKKKTHM